MVLFNVIHGKLAEISILHSITSMMFQFNPHSIFNVPARAGPRGVFVEDDALAGRPAEIHRSEPALPSEGDL